MRKECKRAFYSLVSKYLKGIALHKVSHDSPACPSEKSSVQVKMTMGILMKWYLFSSKGWENKDEPATDL
jgi:hypothetical protein